MSKYQLIMWDFDGTLADTLSVSVQIYNELAQEYKLKEIDDVEKVRSLSFRAFLKEYRVTVLKLPGLMRRFLARQREQISTVSLFPGIAAVLGDIHESGTPQGILSSNNQDNISTCLNQHGVDDRFDFVMGYPRLFGKAKALRTILRDRQMAAEQLLYIGDEIRDIRAAQKVGVPVAAVTWGFNHEARLQEHQPDFLVQSVEDLLAIL